MTALGMPHGLCSTVTTMHAVRNTDAHAPTLTFLTLHHPPAAASEAQPHGTAAGKPWEPP